MAEAVTMAHVARVHVLAEATLATGAKVLVARDPRYSRLFGGARYAARDIKTIPTASFLDALAHGRRTHTLETLRSCVLEDLAVIEDFRPDLVVGDFRLSLAVSARLAHVPFVALTNAYWSAYAKTRFPAPDLPWVRIVGSRAANALFRVVQSHAFAWHALPFNAVRREFGLPELGNDLCRIYTDADHTLYADAPEMVPTCRLPPTHEYLGPIHWSPDVPLPAWWDEVPRDRPTVYVNLGSSGPARLLPVMLAALAELPVTVIGATAGYESPRTNADNVFLADYLPGDLAASRANLVICNGGSPSTQQALAAGVPVLGIAANLDQLANMQYVQACGAGKLLRSSETTSGRLRGALASLLNDERHAASAAEMRRLFQGHDATARFADVVERLVP